MQLQTLFVTALAVALSRAQDDEETPDLTTLIGDTEDLSSLGALLEAYPDIAEMLASAENVTVFAPNNEAFEALPGVEELLEGNSADAVEELLLYHVVPQAVYSESVSNTTAFLRTMLNQSVTDGQVIGARLDGEDVILTSGFKNVSTVVQADANFTGGVVHIIDAVLTLPPDLETVAFAANLSSLAGALTATDLVGTLNETEDLTIFAPNNAAFQAIGSAVDDLSTDDLASILQYHVIAGDVAYSSLLGNGSVEALDGTELTITIQDGDVFVNGAQVINTDILFEGGVIHVIDSVLNPNNTDQEPAADSTEVAFSGASSGTVVPFTTFLEGTPAQTPVSELAGTSSSVAENLPENTGGAVADDDDEVVSGGEEDSEESPDGAGSKVTGALGVAALFGAAVLVANW